MPTGAGLRPGAKAPDEPPDPTGGAPALGPYRRAATGNGATARSEAPASAKAAGNSYPLCLPPPRQSSTLLGDHQVHRGGLVVIGVARGRPARPPRPGGGSDKRGSVNLMPVGMTVSTGTGPPLSGAVSSTGAGSCRLPTSWGPTSWGPTSSVRPSRRSCAPIPPSSPRPVISRRFLCGLTSGRLSAEAAVALLGEERRDAEPGAGRRRARREPWCARMFSLRFLEITAVLGRLRF